MTCGARSPSSFSASVANGGGIVDDTVYLALSGRQIGL